MIIESRKNNFQFSIFNFQSIINFKFKILNSRRSRLGFTLLEMLVVMAIIAILAAATSGNFFSSLAKGRDSRRKQDLQAISKALEMYYNDNRSYPNPTIISKWGEPFPHPTVASIIYMQQIPADPLYPGFTYCYISDSGGTYYKLYAHLDNNSDPQIIPTVACPAGGAIKYNYGISSVNTSP